MTIWESPGASQLLFMLLSLLIQLLFGRMFRADSVSNHQLPSRPRRENRRSEPGTPLLERLSLFLCRL